MTFECDLGSQKVVVNTDHDEWYFEFMERWYTFDLIYWMEEHSSIYPKFYAFTQRDAAVYGRQYNYTQEQFVAVRQAVKQDVMKHLNDILVKYEGRALEYAAWFLSQHDDDGTNDTYRERIKRVTCHNICHANFFGSTQYEEIAFPNP